MKKRYIITFLITIILFILAFDVIAKDSSVFHWYCIRNKEHKQPCCDANMSFIENHNGYYIDKNHGDTCKEKIVYLTFDAGYENGNIAKILDVLKKEQVPGGFFVLGNLITSNPDLIKRMVNEGHLVCNHTYSHKDMSNKTEQEFAAELQKLEDAYKALIGHPLAKYYRPPKGTFSHANMEWANKLGYKTIFWSFAYEDWDNNKQPAKEKAKEKILSNMHNGAVLLLHPTSSTNAEILDEIIQALKEQGYEFGTLDQLTS